MKTRLPAAEMVCWYFPALTVEGWKSKLVSCTAPGAVENLAAYQARSLPWARVKCPPA